MKSLRTRFRSAFTAVLLLFVTLCAFSCKNEEVPPTGDIVVKVRRSDLQMVEYNVYTEALLTANSYVPPIRKGTLNSGASIKIKGLNQGNYVMQLNAGYNWRIMLQVTAGKENTFYIE